MQRVLAIFVAFSLAACGDSSSDGTADAAASADAAAPPADATVGPTPDARPPTPDAGPQPQGATCNDPFALDPAPATFSASTDGLGNFALGTCASASGAAVESVHRVDLPHVPVDLIATVTVDDAAEPPFDAVVYARSQCWQQTTELACIDAGWGETLEVLDAVGPVYLFVDGSDRFGGATAGSYTLTTATRAIAPATGPCQPGAVGPRCPTGLRCVDHACVTDSVDVLCSTATPLALPADVTGQTLRFLGDFAAGSCRADHGRTFAEDVYVVELAAPGTLVARTDHPETAFDTVLYLRAACTGGELACADDVDVTAHDLRSHLVVPDLPAGTYYLFVDGSSEAPGAGGYRLTVAVE